MDVREIPRILFSEFATLQVGPAQSNALGSDASALIGQTVEGVWLKYEDDGSQRGYSTATRVLLYTRSYDARNDGTAFGSIGAGVIYGDRCYDHKNCSLICGRLWLGTHWGRFDFDRNDPTTISITLAQMLQRAYELYHDPSVDHGAICSTAQHEADDAMYRLEREQDAPSA